MNKRKKFKKEQDIIIQGASGFCWNITKMAKEVGWDAALEFARRLQEDREMEERRHQLFGRYW